jgi:hypothetical protein
MRKITALLPYCCYLIFIIQEHIQEERFGTRIERECLVAKNAKHQEDEIMALCGIPLSNQNNIKEEDERYRNDRLLEEARNEVRLILGGTGGADLSPEAIEALVQWKIASL